MLDLKKLENEINNFLAEQTAESYNELFARSDEEEYFERVKLSGGYTDLFDCSQEIIINPTSTVEVNCDFSGHNYKDAA
jgi:hypothetical protein